MRRYPTRNGIPISPYELGYTKPTPEDYGIRRRVNIHHGVFPWSKLREHSISIVFGSLVTNTFPMIATEHNMGRFNLHHDYEPPVLPSLDRMVDVVDEYLALNGIIDCRNHGNTNEMYQVTAQKWDRLVGRNG